MAQSIETLNPTLATAVIALGTATGASLLAYLGFRLVRSSTRHTATAGLATIGLPILVEVTLQRRGAPLDPHGFTVLCVLFYWAISALLAVLLLVGVFLRPYLIARRSNIISHPEIQ